MYHNSTSRAQHSAALYHLQFEVLLRANQAIAVQNDLRSGIRTIIQSATEAVACQRCTLFLVSRARQQLTVATSAGFNEGAHAKLADVKLAIDSKSLVGHCAKVAKGRLVPPTHCLASCSPTCVCHRPPRLATVSWLAMPTLTRAFIQASIKPQSTDLLAYGSLIALPHMLSLLPFLPIHPPCPPAFAQSRWRVCL